MNRMKPILFSAPMVQAILEGRKTQTRRIVKPKRNSRCRMSLFNAIAHISGKWFGVDFNNVPFINDLIEQPKCKPGDILWVRETWRDRWGMAYANYGTGNAYPIDDVREIEYKAGGNGFFMHGCNLCPDEPTVKWGEWSKWRPSIFMPRDAARIFLRVTNVRVERLQDITEEDAIAEGIRIGIGGEPYFSCRDAFVALWNSINTKRGYGWDSNPWVWVYEFERAEGMKC